MDRIACPLSHIRVLDFSRFLSGPCCGMLLADMGAEVIRVEPPRGGVDRTWGILGPDGETMTFKATARNKKGITLRPEKEEGRAVFNELLKHTDVVLHNFAPGSPQEKGLDYQVLKAVNPRIILGVISGFGLTGPDRERTSFDFVAQARSGAMTLNGFPGDPPLKTTTPYIDVSSGMAATIGILAALLHRESTGVGQVVDVSLLDTSVFMTQAVGALLFYETYHRMRESFGNHTFSTYGTCLKARDGYVMLSAATDGIWSRFLKATGCEQLAADPRCQCDFDRSENADSIDLELREWAKDKTVRELIQLLDEERVPCGPVNRVDCLREDPQIAARDMIVDVVYPGLGTMPLPGVFIKLSETPGAVESRSPALGEHNGEVYSDLLGLSPERIKELQKKGII